MHAANMLTHFSLPISGPLNKAIFYIIDRWLDPDDD